MDALSGILGTLSGLIPVDQIADFLTGIADKVPALEGIITTIVEALGGLGA